MAYEINIQKAENSRIGDLDEDNIGFGKLFSDHMFVVDFDGKQWVNPRITPYGNMSLSPSTSALHYGQSIFEGMKAFHYNGQVALFRPELNARRLNISAKRLVMPEIPEELFLAGLEKLIALDAAWVPKSEGSSLYIRPFMFATDEYVGVKPSEKYRFVIFCCPVGPYYNKPLRVKVEETYSRAAPGGTGFAKCAGNYGGALYPTKLAQEAGFDQVLWTDPETHQYVEETGTTNFFAVWKDKVVTPEISETLLDGITRKSVIELLESFGTPVEERPLSVSELKNAIRNQEIRELFITGTAATLINLTGIGHEGEFYDVMETGDTSLSVKIKSAFDGIRTGTLADTFGWMHVVPSETVTA